MTEPENDKRVGSPMNRLNPTVIALIGGLLVLLLVIAYFQSRSGAEQDRLEDPQLAQAEGEGDPAKRCSSRATYDAIKRELFRRAAQLRGSDHAAYDRLSANAVVRMENPVLESEDENSGALNCSGSLSLDLPPGVAVVGGRRTLMADVDYTIQPAADGSGDVILLRNADAIIAPLATLARVAQPAQPVTPPLGDEIAPAEPAAPAPSAPPAADQPPRPVGARPSFDCRDASTRGEIAVCSDAGLAALDRSMAAQFSRAMAVASPEQRELLQSTRSRFLAFRDRCPTNACIGDAYTGRMREIRDIMEGRWRPPR